MFKTGDYVRNTVDGATGIVRRDEDSDGQVGIEYTDRPGEILQGPASLITLATAPGSAPATVQSVPGPSMLVPDETDLALAYARTSGTLTGALRVIDIEARVCLANYDVGDQDPRNKALEFIHAYCSTTLRQNSDS